MVQQPQWISQIENKQLREQTFREYQSRTPAQAQRFYQERTQQGIQQRQEREQQEAAAARIQINYSPYLSNPDYTVERDAAGRITQIYQKPKTYTSDEHNKQTSTYIPHKIIFKEGKAVEELKYNVFAYNTKMGKYRPYDYENTKVTDGEKRIYYSGVFNKKNSAEIRRDKVVVITPESETTHAGPLQNVRDKYSAKQDIREQAIKAGAEKGIGYQDARKFLGEQETKSTPSSKFYIRPEDNKVVSTSKNITKEQEQELMGRGYVQRETPSYQAPRTYYEKKATASVQEQLKQFEKDKSKLETEYNKDWQDKYTELVERGKSKESTFGLPSEGYIQTDEGYRFAEEGEKGTRFYLTGKGSRDISTGDITVGTTWSVGGKKEGLQEISVEEAKGLEAGGGRPTINVSEKAYKEVFEPVYSKWRSDELKSLDAKQRSKLGFGGASEKEKAVLKQYEAIGTKEIKPLYLPGATKPILDITGTSKSLGKKFEESKIVDIAKDPFKFTVGKAYGFRMKRIEAGTYGTSLFETTFPKKEVSRTKFEKAETEFKGATDAGKIGLMVMGKAPGDIKPFVSDLTGEERRDLATSKIKGAAVLAGAGIAGVYTSTALKAKLGITFIGGYEPIKETLFEKVPSYFGTEIGRAVRETKKQKDYGKEYYDVMGNLIKDLPSESPSLKLSSTELEDVRGKWGAGAVLAADTASWFLMKERPMIELMYRGKEGLKEKPGESALLTATGFAYGFLPKVLQAGALKARTSSLGLKLTSFGTTKLGKFGQALSWTPKVAGAAWKYGLPASFIGMKVGEVYSQPDYSSRIKVIRDMDRQMLYLSLGAKGAEGLSGYTGLTGSIMRRQATLRGIYNEQSLMKGLTPEQYAKKAGFMEEKKGIPFKKMWGEFLKTGKVSDKTVSEIELFKFKPTAKETKAAEQMLVEAKKYGLVSSTKANKYKLIAEPKNELKTIVDRFKPERVETPLSILNQWRVKQETPKSILKSWATKDTETLLTLKLKPTKVTKYKLTDKGYKNYLESIQAFEKYYGQPKISIAESKQLKPFDLKSRLDLVEDLPKAIGKGKSGSDVMFEFVKGKDLIVGGSTSLMTYFPEPYQKMFKFKAPGDVDVFLGSKWGMLTRGKLYLTGEKLRLSFEKAGFKPEVAASGKAYKITIGGKKAVELHSYEMFEAMPTGGLITSRTAKDIFRDPLMKGYKRTTEGVKVLDITPQTRNLLLGAYYNIRMAKDYPRFKKSVKGQYEMLRDPWSVSYEQRQDVGKRYADYLKLQNKFLKFDVLNMKIALGSRGEMETWKDLKMDFKYTPKEVIAGLEGSPYKWIPKARTPMNILGEWTETGWDRKYQAPTKYKKVKVSKPYSNYKLPKTYPAYKKYESYPTYKPYKEYKPYKPYKPYSPYSPYKPYKPYSPYTPYKPYKPYTPYKPYKPYSPYKPYKPYTPYKPYKPYSPYKPYKPYKPYQPYKPTKTTTTWGGLPSEIIGLKPKGKKKKIKMGKRSYTPTLVGMTYLPKVKGTKALEQKVWGLSARPQVK